MALILSSLNHNPLVTHSSVMVRPGIAKLKHNRVNKNKKDPKNVSCIKHIHKSLNVYMYLSHYTHLWKLLSIECETLYFNDNETDQQT